MNPPLNPRRFQPVGEFGRAAFKLRTRRATVDRSPGARLPVSPMAGSAP